jgi:hypothetical protein
MHQRRRRRQPNPQSDAVQLNARAALPFAVLLALFSGAHGIAAKLGWVKSQVKLAAASAFHSRCPSPAR